MSLKPTSYYKKIGPRLKLIKKRGKHCNAGYHYMLRPKKPINNSILIALFRSKRVKIL